MRYKKYISIQKYINIKIYKIVFFGKFSEESKFIKEIISETWNVWNIYVYVNQNIIQQNQK